MKIQSNLLLFFLFFYSDVNAQIPNKGFEDWTNMGSYMSPDGWWTTNDSASGTFYPATRSTDHYPTSVGSYSIRIENNMSVLPDWGGFGIAWTGNWYGNDNPVFPVNGHPTSLHGYYKFLPQNNDTMDVHIRLYKNGTDVSGGQFKSAATVNSWTPFSLVLTNYTDADSARIMIASCYDNDAPNPHGNSVLFVDNLNFDTLITDEVPESDAAESIMVYPNPATEHFLISAAGNNSQDWQFDLFNALGEKVFSIQPCIKHGVTLIDVRKLDNGLYYLKGSAEGRKKYAGKINVWH